MQAPPEQLGSFYLGVEYDLETGQRLEQPINYDARDLTTHAICVGMTGSGKTGLCISLLEEAALDKVPTILIDPKGDITNLLLQFPELHPDDFITWINPDDARRKGQTEAEYAQATAESWRKGLADWGISPERIRMLHDTTEFTIYTPGSDAGMPVSILGSLAAPELDFNEHAEAIRERISGTVAALLGLVGLNADPIRSREAILLFNIFEHFWSQNQSLDLPKLILSLQNPPVRQLGVFDVDTFFPQKDRFDLAMAFNNLVASPSFQYWLKGDPLDIDRLLYNQEGKPRQNIFYIAHLSDEERMFFVTLLLESMVAWMRRQTGTTSLRALLYFDEIFGFFPPTAEPPSKRPLLTLLKQARAFGLGCLLVTQNPVDLDYKGLTNAGTWFIGKLQAERDKARVLEGLNGAIAAAGGRSDKIDYDALLSQVGNRVFLLHNVHAGKPVVFETRWAMSYLRGPLTKPQVQRLMQPRKQTAAPANAVTAGADPAAPQPGPAAPVAAPARPAGFSSAQPALDPAVPQFFLPLSLSEQDATHQLAQKTGLSLEATQTRLVYEPAILAATHIHYVDRKRKIDHEIEEMRLAPAPERSQSIDWKQVELLPLGLNDLQNASDPVDEAQGPFFAPGPQAINNLSKVKTISKELANWLYYNSRLKITTHPELNLFQPPAEDERAFKIRLQQAARERRDAEVDALERKYEDRLERLRLKLKKEERELAQTQAKYDSHKHQEMSGIRDGVLGIFFKGRRKSGSFIGNVMERRRQTGQVGSELEVAQADVAGVQQEVNKLEAELQQAADEITRRWEEILDHLASDEIAPQRNNIRIQQVALAWRPAWLITYNSEGVNDTAAIAAYSTTESS